jgi:hypothetical protein
MRSGVEIKISQNSFLVLKIFLYANTNLFFCFEITFPFVQMKNNATKQVHIEQEFTKIRKHDY